MIESKWLTCADPARMLESVRRLRPDRKFRLFAVACCRRIWHLLADERLKHAVESAEAYADGASSATDLARMDREVNRSWRAAYESLPVADKEAVASLVPSAAATAASVAEAVGGAVLEDPWLATSAHYLAAIATTGTWRSNRRPPAEQQAQADLLRDLFGPTPYRARRLDARWSTPTVLSLARAAYEERQLPTGFLDAVRLCILADALEEAFCDDDELLAHLRSPGPHVRGCWALDLVMGK